MNNLLLNKELRYHISFLSTLILSLILFTILSNIIFENKFKITEEIKLFIDLSDKKTEIPKKNITKQNSFNKTKPVINQKNSFKKIEQKEAPKTIKKNEIKNVKKKSEINEHEKLIALLNNTKKIKSDNSDNRIKINNSNKNLNITTKSNNKIKINEIEKNIDNSDIINQEKINIKNSNQDKNYKNIMNEIKNKQLDINSNNENVQDNYIPVIENSNDINVKSENFSTISSSKTLSIISSPDLDATNFLRKGEHYAIEFSGIIDNSGFIKTIKLTKSSGNIKLDNIAKQHIINNWRWSPGFNNAKIDVIRLYVENRR